MDNFGNEAMQNYPFATVPILSNWKQLTLTEISVEISPGFASGKHNSTGLGIPHLRPMNVSRDGKIDLSIIKSVSNISDVALKSGDILFNNTNSAELVGKTAVISHHESGFAFSNHMTRVRLESGISPAFIARQLHFLWMSGYMMHRCTNHVNQASISSQILGKTIPILLPPSAEQTRIVEKLEELFSDLDSGVAELKAAQKKLALYRQSLLKAAVEGALTADWRKHNQLSETGAQLLERILAERRARWEAKQLAKFKEQGKNPPQDWQKKYPEPIQPNTTDLPELPEGWAWATIDQLSFVVRGASPRPAGDPRYFGGVIPWITVGSLTADEDMYLVEVDQFVTEAGKEASRFIEPNTLLLTNSGATLGVPKITKIGGCINDGSVAFLDIEEARKIYLYWYLSTQTKKLRALNQGAAQPNLNTDIVRKICVPICSSDELEEINRVLEAAAHSIKEQAKAVNHSLKQSAAQRQNILRAAFSGQLVPQDPNDEPASVLLERIRAERLMRPEKKKAFKKKEKNEQNDA